MKKLLIVYIIHGQTATPPALQGNCKALRAASFCKSTPPYRMQEVTMMW